MPRIDHNKIFDQLKKHDNSIETARAALTAANAVIAAHCKPDDGGVGTAFHNLSAALASILKGNEILKSAVLDSCKLPPHRPRHTSGGGDSGSASASEQQSK